MRPRDLAELLLLAALWGGSFLVMRLAVGEFGAVPLTQMRVMLAAAALVPCLAWLGGWQQGRTHWRAIATVGLVNSALPFMLWGYAAHTLTAGLSAIFNATAPLWGALIAWAWLGDRPSRSQGLGLGLGFLGVAWLAWDKVGVRAGSGLLEVALAISACLVATLCYGYGINFTKRHLTGVAPMAVAAGTQTTAALALALPAALTWPAQPPGTVAWGAVLTLGLACTGLAYLLYFRLIAHIGPSRAMTVTFLIPFFAALWGWCWLDEAVTPVMMGAGAVILAGTALATGLVGRPAAQRR